MDRRRGFQEKLRRLSLFDESFVEGEAGLGLGPVKVSVLDPKITALVQLGALVTMGAAAPGLEWAVNRALAAGATEDEVTDVLLAVAPVTGLGLVIGAAPKVAIALGYDVDSALEGLDDD